MKKKLNLISKIYNFELNIIESVVISKRIYTSRISNTKKGGWCTCYTFSFKMKHLYQKLPLSLKQETPKEYASKILKHLSVFFLNKPPWTKLKIHPMKHGKKLPSSKHARIHLST